MSEGVSFTESAAERIADAVRWVESNRRGPETRSLARQNELEPILVRVTSATPDGDGNFPAVLTVWGPGGAAYVDYQACKLKAAGGEALTNGKRYLAIATGVNGSSESVYIAGTLTAAAGTLTVVEVDGSPSVGSVAELRFDQTDGFVVSTPGAGIARVDISSASTTQAGIVDLVSQTWIGNKGVYGRTNSGGVFYDTTITLFSADSGTQVVQSTTVGHLKIASILDVFGAASPLEGRLYADMLVLGSEEGGPGAPGVFGFANSIAFLADASISGSPSAGLGWDPVGSGVATFAINKGTATGIRYSVVEGAFTFNGVSGTLPGGATVKGGIVVSAGTGGIDTGGIESLGPPLTQPPPGQPTGSPASPSPGTGGTGSLGPLTGPRARPFRPPFAGGAAAALWGNFR